MRARVAGMALVVLGVGTVALAAACGSAEFGANPLFDAGSSSGSGDSGVPEGGVPPPDGGPDGQAADAGLSTTALFIQGSPSLPDVRLCWSTNGGAPGHVLPFPSAGAMPASNYPGIPLGGVTALDDASGLASASVTLYALDAEVLARLDEGQASQTTCDALLACPNDPNPPPPCIRSNYDYWQLDPLTAGLAAGSTNVVALAGCLPVSLDGTATAASCGPGWDALKGNLHADVARVAGSGVAGGPDAGQLALQAAQLSPALAALLGDAGGAVVTFGAQEAGALAPVATLRQEGDLEPSLPQVVTVGTDLSAYGAMGFGVAYPVGDGGMTQLWMSLAQAQQLVDPTQDPAQFFGQPRTYVVAVVGDPAAPSPLAGGGASDGGAYDGKGLHVLVVAAPSAQQDAGSP